MAGINWNNIRQKSMYVFQLFDMREGINVLVRTVKRELKIIKHRFFYQINCSVFHVAARLPPCSSKRGNINTGAKSQQIRQSMITLKS